MMMTKEDIEQLPPSVKKHIRKEKARIRRNFTDTEKEREELDKLYEKFRYYVEDKKKENSK